MALVYKYKQGYCNLPEVYEVSQPLLSIVWLFFSCIGRHVGQVVHNNKHLDNCTKWIEEGHLYGATTRNVVTLLAEIDMPL